MTTEGPYIKTVENSIRPLSGNAHQNPLPQYEQLTLGVSLPPAPDGLMWCFDSIGVQDSHATLNLYLDADPSAHYIQ